MSKHEDDKHERIRTLTVEGETGPVMYGSGDDTPAETPRRSRRVPAVVDDAGLNILDRAVMLYLAKRAIMEPTSQVLYGQALVQFAKGYVQQEFAKGGGA